MTEPYAEIAPPEHWFVEEVRSLRKLALNWNSYGGLPITEKAIQAACRQELVPSPDGGLTINLSRGLDDLEIGIGPDGTIRYVLWEKRQPRAHEEHPKVSGDELTWAGSMQPMEDPYHRPTPPDGGSDA